MRKSLLHGPRAGIQPTRSAFDFQSGAFVTAHRVRNIVASVALASIAACGGATFIGAHAMLETKTQNILIASARAETDAAMAKLSRTQAPDGVGSDELRMHVEHRQSVYLAAVGNEIGVVALTGNLIQAAPAGVSVTSITFSAPPAPDAAADPSTAASPDAAVGATSDPAKSADPAPVLLPTVGTVSIEGSGSLAAVGAWNDAVGKIQGLSAVQMTWTGGADQAMAKITAEITREGLTSRAVTAANQQQTPPAAAPSAPGTEGGK